MKRQQSALRNITNSPVIRLFAFLLPALVATIACAGGTHSAPSTQHPSSQELVDHFYAHRAEFETLRLLFVEDEGLERVSPYHTLPEDLELPGVTEQRIEEYRMLFQELGLEHGISSFDGKDTLWFIASEFSWDKGYLYTDKCEETLVDDVDTAWATYGSSSSAYYLFCQHIEGNWYIFLYSGD